MKKSIIIAGTVLTFTLGGLGFTGNTVQAEQSVTEKKANVSQKLNKVETEILNTTKKINSINLDIQALESAINANEEEVQRVTKEVAKFKEEISKLEKEIKVLENEIEIRNGILKERLSSYQISGGDIGFKEVIFGAAGFEDFISRFTAVTAITVADNKLVEEQRVAISKVEEIESKLKAKLESSEKNQKELSEINNEKKIQKEELSNAKTSIEEAITKLEEEKAGYVQEGNDLAALETRIEEEVSNDSNNAVATNAPVTNGANTNGANTNGATTNGTVNNSSNTASNVVVRNNTQNNTQSSSPKKKAPVAKIPTSSVSSGGLLDVAHSLKGIPYQYGGTTTSGFDCSGYTSFVYKKSGVNLPRTSSAQYNAYPKVSKGQLRAGDLVFFASPGSGDNKPNGSITHVGISLGGSAFIGSQTSTGVAVSSINDPYHWGTRYAGAVRVR